MLSAFFRHTSVLATAICRQASRLADRLAAMSRPCLLSCIVLLSCAATAASAQDYGSRGNLGETATTAERAEIDVLYERFIPYIDRARTELTMVRETVARAEARGFREWDPALRDPNPGDRFYAVNRDRTMMLWVVGEEPLASGMRLINSHIDSVRLELKPYPLASKKGVAVLDTLVHGGIKPYQWVNVPLGLTGRVDKKDGSVVWIDYGFDEDDPVLLIPDLAPHVDRDLRSRTRQEAIKREELDPLITSAPTPGNADGEADENGNADAAVIDAMARAVALVEEEFGIEPDDWVSSDIQLVPVTRPREVGLDRELFAAFGLDDRLAGIASVFALEDLGTPTHTAVAYLVTDEEVGSGSNIGVASEWFRKIAAEMIRAENGAVSELDVMESFSNTDMITADTTTATNPLWPSPQAPDNASLLHHGLVIKLYGAGRSANSEFVARLRKMLDDANVAWQSHTYKAGYGGGTIARYFNAMNMEVTDWGVGILSMHSTYSVASKADLWALYDGFVAFFES